MALVGVWDVHGMFVDRWERDVRHVELCSVGVVGCRRIYACYSPLYLALSTLFVPVLYSRVGDVVLVVVVALRTLSIVLVAVHDDEDADRIMCAYIVCMLKYMLCTSRYRLFQLWICWAVC